MEITHEKLTVIKLNESEFTWLIKFLEKPTENDSKMRDDMVFSLTGNRLTPSYNSLDKRG